MLNTSVAPALHTPLQDLYLAHSSHHELRIWEKHSWPEPKIITSGYAVSVLPSFASPRTLVKANAEAKTDKIVKILDDQKLKGMVIAFDQLKRCGKRILGKPKNNREAYEFLQMYKDNEVEVFSAVVVHNMYTNKRECGISYSKLVLPVFSNKEILELMKLPFVLQSPGGFALSCDEIIDKRVKIIQGNVDDINGVPIGLTKKLISKTGYQKKLP